MSAARLERERSLLLVIDIQERLAPQVAGYEAILARTGALIAAAGLLAIPRRLTEHCPDELGPVVAPLRTQFAGQEVFAKSSFGAVAHEDFVALLQATGRTQIVVAGMEAHVCVLQTVLGLREREFEVFAVADAIGSRVSRADDRIWALERMRAAGAILAGTETVLFEWTLAATDPRFRSILGLVKSLP